MIRSSPVLAEKSFCEAIAEVKFQVIGMSLALVAVVLIIVAMVSPGVRQGRQGAGPRWRSVRYRRLGAAASRRVAVRRMLWSQGMPLWQGSEESGRAVAAGGFGVTVCSSDGSSCATASGFGVVPESVGVATLVEAPASGGLVGGLLLAASVACGVSFVVMAGLRARDEALMGRVVDCCELRAKIIVPVVGLGAAVFAIAGCAAAAAVSSGSSARGDMGAGAALGIMSGVLLLAAAGLVAATNKEVQGVRYRRRIEAEAAMRRSRSWNKKSGGTAAVLAATSKPASDGRPAGLPLEGSNPLLAGRSAAAAP